MIREPVTIEPRKALTVESLREVFTYNPETGEFVWLPRPREKFSQVGNYNIWTRRYAGRPAFTMRNVQGYLVGRVFCRRIKAHHAAWAIHYGEWPADILDHIDGDPTNNRIANLRAVGAVENARNHSRRADNSSGINGVHWNRKCRKWRATIAVAGRVIHLGLFSDKEDAAAARLAANERYGFSPRHGAAR